MTAIPEELQVTYEQLADLEKDFEDVETEISESRSLSLPLSRARAVSHPPDCGAAMRQTVSPR